MTPKELIDKITLAAEQLESLRTEHDLPMYADLRDYALVVGTSNKKGSIEILHYSSGIIDYYRNCNGEPAYFDTYEELVEDIK